MTKEDVISRKDALEKLSEFGITGANVYLIDIIPLVEMIWADGHAQDSEVAILENYLEKHVAHVNELAGYEFLTLDEAKAFLTRFVQNRPNPEVMTALRSLVAPIRLSTSDSEANEQLRGSLLSACLDIASSAVTQYPYGFRDRFNPAEKRCFFEILETL